MISRCVYVSTVCNSQPYILPSFQLSCSNSATQRVFCRRGDERGFDTFMCWTRDNHSANQMVAYLNVALQFTLKIATKGHVGKIVLYICLMLQMSLRILYSISYVKKIKIIIIIILKYIKILVGTTLSFPNFGCDLSLLSLCKRMPLLWLMTVTLTTGNNSANVVLLPGLSPDPWLS